MMLNLMKMLLALWRTKGFGGRCDFVLLYCVIYLWLVGLMLIVLVFFFFADLVMLLQFMHTHFLFLNFCFVLFFFLPLPFLVIVSPGLAHSLLYPYTRPFGYLFVFYFLPVFLLLLALVLHTH